MEPEIVERNRPKFALASELLNGPVWSVMGN
jgi:hypothetical protein